VNAGDGEADAADDAAHPVRIPKLQFFEDEAGEWRWRVRAANGEIVNGSTEGYVNRSGAMRGYETAVEIMTRGPLKIEMG
jgi:uncharacterized protein YegP (UPF0339 family)